MRKVHHLLTIALIAIAATSMAQPGQSQQDADMPPMGMNCERMDGMLGLTEEQSTKIETLKLAHQKALLPLRNELNEKRARLRTLSTVDKPDTKAIDQLIDEMGVLEVKLQKERVHHQLAVRNELTEEQRLKFDTMGRGMAFDGNGPQRRENKQFGPCMQDGNGPQQGQGQQKRKGKM